MVKNNIFMGDENMKLKKLFAGLATGIMVIGLIGCGNNSDKLQEKLKANL